jgi:hypothetical protein
MRGTPIVLALIFAAFCARAADSVLVFNEVQYHPPAGQSEWIELRSLQGVDVNIGGWRIEGGVDYTFPAGTVSPLRVHRDWHDRSTGKAGHHNSPAWAGSRVGGACDGEAAGTLVPDFMPRLKTNWNRRNRARFHIARFPFDRLPFGCAPAWAMLAVANSGDALKAS